MMIISELKKISKILKDKDKKYYVVYFFAFIFISILETMSVGLIPAYFTIIIDTNLLLEQLRFNTQLYEFSKSLFDKGSIILYFTYAILLFFLLKFIYSIIFHFFEAKYFNIIKINLSTSLTSLYLRKNYIFHTENNPLVLSRNVTSEVNTTAAYLKSFVIVIKEIIQIFFILLLLLFANFKITILILSLSTILAFIYLKIFSSKLAKKSKISFYERGEKSKIIDQIFNLIIEVKLYNKSKYFVEKFSKSITREFESNMFFDYINKLPRIFLEFFIVCLVIGSMFFALFLKLDLIALVPIIALYFFAALRVYPSLNAILLNRLSLINGQVSIDQIYSEILNANKDIDLYENSEKKLDFENFLELKNISFKYKNRITALKNINLKINKYETIGIVGETGSGKSTLIKIIMGFLEPDSGSVFIDKNELKDIKKSWQKKIGYVPQNFSMLDDSIAANILFGENEKDIKKIYNIIKEVSLDKFINTLPDKIDTLVGPNAKQVSGGQAQRIAIARALYQNPQLLIFDEATNSLDEKTEKEIMNNIYSLKNRTSIIITHKKSLLDGCNKIFKIENNGVINIK